MALLLEKLTRRRFVAAGGSLALATIGAASFPFHSLAAALPFLDVAYAGSMGSMMEGPLKAAVRSELQLDMHGRAQGSNALARLIVGGSIRPDVFVPVTPGPMMTVLRHGRAKSAEPIAHTEMVIAYSPKSRFARQFKSAALGRAEWWKVLEQPGLRFGRTDPIADPQGRNIIFTVMLAAKMYHQPDLVEKTLGPTINATQIFSEATVLARLQSGELDASSAYKIQPGPFHLPYVSLPQEINLSSEHVRQDHPSLNLTVGGRTYYPEPLIYYAAALSDSLNPQGAAEFVQWLKGNEAQSIFRRYDYDSPDRASTLRP
jgi:molybdate/tungstate transport system substrate-binding protein